MKVLKYFAPKDMTEALHILADNRQNTLVLAGGTDVVPKINSYNLKPESLLYIGQINLNYIIQDNGRLIIGSGTTWNKLASDPIIYQSAPILSEAACQGSCFSVRNSATIGGNLVNASPAADLATPLLIIDTELVLKSSKGERVVPAKDFFIGPGKTVLKPEELVTEIHIPSFGGNTVFFKIGRRKAMTLSVVNTAVRVDMDGKTCREVRIALGSMAPTPMRCVKAEKMLTGQPINGISIRKCAAEAIAEVCPIDDQRATAWYRKKVGENLVSRALFQAVGIEE